MRDAIAAFAEGNVDRLQDWLDEIALDNPAKAVDIYVKLLEYHVPKLRASDDTLEIQGEVGIRTINKSYVGTGSDG